MKKPLIYTVEIFFALFTAYVIIYAYHHQEKSELVYLIFNSYALLAIIISFAFLVYREHAEYKKQAAARLRLKHLAQNLTAPAMLWDDSFRTVILNEALSNLSGMQSPENGSDAKFMVPWFFGKKSMDADDIRRIIRAKNEEYSFRTKNGQEHRIIWNTSPIETDIQGVTWYLTIGLDLEEFRTMQSELDEYSKRLAASEGKYLLTMELSEIGMLLIEQGNPNLFPSDRLRDMLGIKSQTITAEELRKRVYPLDTRIFEQNMDRMRNHMRDFLDHVQRIEIRLCSADGQYRWYAYRCRATQRSDTGRLVIGGSVIDINDEKEKDARIERIAYEDSVTGIPNRNKLMRMGQELYQCTIELGSSYWVIVMDIDRFHLINDACGYANGNALLKSFAEVLNQQQAYGGFGARISGDNFALILRDGGDEKLPGRVVSKIQRTLATKAVGAFSNRALTCSAGYARMPADGDNFEHVLEHAEFALSSMKDLPGTVQRYTSAMHDSIIQESNLEAQLAEALIRQELVLYYQPKVSLETGEIIGMEALVRWKHPSGKLLSPTLFIPIAEKSQLITNITRFVMDEACSQAKLWQKMGMPETVISINMSSTDFYQANICQQILKTLERHDLDPRYLEIELTESLALKDIDLTIAQMQLLRSAGIQIAMDDFGTGYSSLSYMQKLPFTMIKLDRAFVMHMEDDDVMREIVQSVVRIAKAKKIRTIAEGVETPEQARFLRDCGCDYIQGFLYGHPMTAREIEQYMRDNKKHRIVY